MGTTMQKLDVNGWSLTVMGDEARVLDLDVARAARVKVPASVRSVIARNRDELEAHGTLEVFDYQSKTSGGRPGRQYLLNEAQAIALVSLMRTPYAAMTRIALVKAFIAFRRGLSAAVPLDLMQGPRVDDVPTVRAELVRRCALAAKSLGVSLHRIHGAIRHTFNVSSPYLVAIYGWGDVRDFLEALAAQEMLLPARRARRLPAGRSAQLPLPWPSRRLAARSPTRRTVRAS